MRALVVGLCLAWAAATGGCTQVFEAVAAAAIDEAFDNIGGSGASPGPVVFDLPDEALNASSSISFLTGADSGNVYCFILGAKSWDPVASFAAGERPLGITAGPDGSLVTTTARDVLKRHQQWVTIDDLNAETGMTEIGLVGATAGEIIVAGETETGALLVVLDATTGAVLDASEVEPGCTTTGLHVTDEAAFASEAPTGDVVRYDLSVSPPRRTVLVQADEILGQPTGLTVGHNGNLFVASGDTPVLQEFDIWTGAPVETLFLSGIGDQGIRDVAFDPDSESYYVTTGGDTIHEIDPAGVVQGSYRQPELAGAASLVIVER